MTLVQIAENPITVAIDDAISSFADVAGPAAGTVLNQPVLVMRRRNNIDAQSFGMWPDMLLQP
jgi:hypothetical protein